MLASTGEAKPMPHPAAQTSPLQPQLGFCWHHGKPEQGWSLAGVQAAVGGTTSWSQDVFMETGGAQGGFQLQHGGGEGYFLQACALHIGCELLGIY